MCSLQHQLHLCQHFGQLLLNLRHNVSARLSQGLSPVALTFCGVGESHSLGRSSLADLQRSGLDLRNKNAIGGGEQLNRVLVCCMVVERWKR